MKAPGRGYLGEKAFRKELLDQMVRQPGQEHYGEERFEADEEQAVRIPQEQLRWRRWTEAKLRLSPKGDRRKVEMAARLRRETTMNQQWIAEKLGMGTASNVSNHLAARRKAVS